MRALDRASHQRRGQPRATLRRGAASARARTSIALGACADPRRRLGLLLVAVVSAGLLADLATAEPEPSPADASPAGQRDGSDGPARGDTAGSSGSESAGSESAGSESAGSESVAPKSGAGADEIRPRGPIQPLSDDNGRGRFVVLADIHGTIELGIAPFVRRVLEASQGAAAVVFDIDTFGGRVDAAVVIRDALLSSDVPTVVFVDRRAISAGALISFAADYIIFNEGGTMGAATPVQLSQGGEAQPVEEKIVSYMRSEMASTAETKGRRGDIARAMVDADEEVAGISPKGELLTLTTTEAVRVGVADGVAKSRDEVLAMLGLSQAERRTIETNWAEGVVRFLTDPTVSGLLLSIGFIALMIELYTPGLGLPGAAALVLLGLFFGGHYMVELAGLEELLVFIAGVICLGIELFVLPGFGVMGMLGIGLMVTSLAMSLVGTSPTIASETGTLTTALGRVMISIAAAGAAMILIVNRLGESRFGGWIVLRTELARGKSPSEEDFRSQPAAWTTYDGQSGEAMTDLRLSGKAKIRGELVDVVSQFEYIPAGTPIVVVEVEGARVVVVRDPAAPKAAPAIAAGPGPGSAEPGSAT